MTGTIKTQKCTMQCSGCKQILDIDKFSYKNEAQKIYYLHCNKCREKITNNTELKAKQKEQYERVKKNNVINCKCGATYVAFRDHHIRRHMNSINHLHFVAKS